VISNALCHERMRGAQFYLESERGPALTESSCDILPTGTATIGEVISVKSQTQNKDSQEVTKMEINSQWLHLSPLHEGASL